MADRFSDRHGYRGQEQEIVVRKAAPEVLRFAIPLIAQDVGMTPTEMRRAVRDAFIGFQRHLYAEEGKVGRQ